MYRYNWIFLLLFLHLSVCLEADQLPDISAITTGMKKHSGFFTFYQDDAGGRLLLEIERWDEEFLYVDALTTGVGSNDIGLDRGQLGSSRVVVFQRSGPKVLLLQRNYAFRAISDNPQERLSVQEAFAQSVLGGFTVMAASGARVLVDATAFLLRDAHDVAGTLLRARQGRFQLDLNRSALYLPNTKSFPRNSEFEVLLTFAGDDPGNYVRDVTPSPQAISVRQRHSFVQLPEPGYQPRPFDPRSGLIHISFQDYATAIGSPLVRRWITRHRLQKKYPQQEVSEVLEPIIYYVDSATPEPVRSALLEGASWWREAFEALGFRDAFQVKLLPADADPLDVRYNVIQWVHRATRGWSYGDFVLDPRTGEIIKGHVSLGSLRVRQDYLLAEGLLAPYQDGREVSPEMEKMALARLRQLAAHEVGHTLGLTHNFAASMFNRASVMDYPHPLVTLDAEGGMDFSRAYARGVGEWDRFAIAYGYREFASGQEEVAGLQALVSGYLQDGAVFIGDADARPAGGAHPQAHLWDNGSDAALELERLMALRRRALDGFSEKAIPPGAPMSKLEEVLVPVYLMHRYQSEAAAKLLGGVDYRYALRGDGQAMSPVPAGQQERALAALLRTLQPQELTLSESILSLIPPPPYGYQRGREHFAGRTGVTLDPLAAAETAAGMTLSLLLHPERATRLCEQHARNNQLPSLQLVLNKLIGQTWKAPAPGGLAGLVKQVTDQQVLQYLLRLAAGKEAAAPVRGLVLRSIAELEEWLAGQRGAKDPGGHYQDALQQIRHFRANPGEWKPEKAPRMPDGSPIGMGELPGAVCRISGFARVSRALRSSRN